MTFIGDALARDHLEPGNERLGLAAAMRLDQSHHHVGALALARLRREQHLVGLADARRGAEENLELAAPFLRRRLEQRLGRGPLVALGSVGGGHGETIALPGFIRSAVHSPFPPLWGGEGWGAVGYQFAHLGASTHLILNPSPP